MNNLQRTPEWHAARLGRLTGSRIADATARTKTGWGASRANYMAELLIERLTGQPAPQYTNAAMEWGTQYEAEAITVYEFEKNVTVDPVGFCPHPSIADAGASPDGLVVGADGMVEVKCPNSATMIDILLGSPIEERNRKQVCFQMACCPERQWCDLVHYDPRMPVHLRMVWRRITRDHNAKLIAQLEKDATDFLCELADKHERLLKFTSLVPQSMDQVAAALKASVELTQHA